MSDTSAILETLHGIASRLDADMSEKDVENAFLNENFYDKLGYKGAGHDLRSEWTLPDDRRPDYVTLDSNESVTAVYEFKTTGRDLVPHEDQLFHYVDELKADYGVLTNGKALRLYRRDGHSRLLTVSLEEATQSDAADLGAALQKPRWDITDPNSVTEFLDRLDEVELDGELGRTHFFETFRLEEDSPFANLVTAMMDLLEELRDEQEAKFVEGAYDFWEASYASEPDKTPDSWEPFIDDQQSLRDFMFCLESGHALLARLLLAKATDDHDFFPNSTGLRRYFDELGGFSGSIELDAYPIAANGMIEDMRNHLVQSLFEDDIFIWWTDGYGKETASQHKNPYSRFESVAKEGSDVSRVSPSTRERFSRAIAHVSFAVLKFDFAQVEGDPLGNLYQKYFDPDTRKALGEFYTPEPVIDYIMDGVEYDVGVSEERIIDPSCGSGTFLVEAVNRYLDDVRRYNDEPDWSEHLTELCTTPHIVGLDIHPFAVLMAQIRFMVAILPEYKEAKQEDDEFTIRRLPIFRTDSLRNERELTGLDLGDDDQTQMTFDSITEDNQDVKIPVPLPIEVDESEVADSELEDGFLVQRVRMPKYDTAKMNAGVRNFGEYYAALQGVLDVVKFHMREGWWEYGGGLEEGIHRYTTRDYDGVEDFFEPYVNDILATVRYLREDHGDGRLFKMFEDTVLSLVVKNYMKYDYVVGNPPWGGILLGSRGALGNESLRDQLREQYDSAYGRYDIYVPFIERGVDWLREDGNLGYITPNRFMKRNYGKETRRILLENTKLDTIVDFGDYDEMFDNATNYPCILITEKESVSESEFEFVTFQDEVHERSVDTVMEHLRESSVPWIKRHRLNQAKLTTDSWSPAKVLASDIVQSVRDGPGQRIGELYNASQGCTIGGKGCEEIFVLSEREAENLNLEEDLLQNVLKGGDIEKWSEPTQDKVLIYPYDDNGDVVDLEDYPETHTYLSEYEKRLESRELDGKNITDWNKEWYELWRPRDRAVLGSQKIITPRLSTENCFAVDLEKHFLLDSAVGMMCPETHYEYLLGFLNSTWSQLYVNSESTYVQNRYWNYSQTVVESLPIVPPEDAVGSEAYNNIEAAVKELLKYRDLRERIDGFPTTYLDESVEIDWVDYTWQTKRSSVDPTINEEDGVISLDAGRTDSIRNALINTETKAKYIRESVEGMNVDSGESISIPIPISDTDVQDVMSELNDDKVRFDTEEITNLENKIDEAVYSLLELDQDEKQTVQDCLDLF
ncbi:Eco57I restriction-modification methylase domain-containing protein [Haloarcula salina]|uniref:Eco57I restriction-modification methylase domain-containing protein n=1 Tax=Haloarcula salina TaxID=1429914 RepID=UPI003C7002B8